MDILDLDADVFHDLFDEVTGRLAELTAARTPALLLDLGAGTGSGVLALLRRFTRAEAIAVDLSPAHLARLREKAAEAGVADRVRAVQADLDAEWPAELKESAGEVDLVWASASLHHLADPAQALRDLRAALRPGGVIAVVELDGFPRFLPEELGAGLEERTHARLAERRAAEMPHLGDDWGPALAAAGFAEIEARTVRVERRPPWPETLHRYARLSLRRLREGLGDLLDAADTAALDALLAEDGRALADRDDLRLRAERQVWIARRP